jgi:hypothetical protein
MTYRQAVDADRWNSRSMPREESTMGQRESEREVVSKF